MTKKGDELVLDLMKVDKEPAFKVGTATSTVAGLVGLILYFAPNLLTEEQFRLVTVVSVFALPIITAFFTRGQVWSPASVQILLDDAIDQTKKQIEDLQKQKDIDRRISGTTVESRPSIYENEEPPVIT